MPPAGSQKPSIEYRHNVAAGRHEIGVRKGKTFVAFATVDDAYYAQLVEHAETTAETDDDGEEEDE